MQVFTRILSLCLTKLAQQIEQLTTQLSSPIEQLDRKQQPRGEQAIAAISSYLEQTALESALTQPLTNLTRQVTRLTAQLSSSPQQLTSAINKFTPDVANYQAQKPTQADEQRKEPIAAPITGSGAPTECVRASTPSSQLLAAQLQILTDQIFAPDAVYQEHGLRIERRQEEIRASINGEPVDLRHPENLATIVTRLQVLVDEFELLSLYEEFATAARLERAIANSSCQLVQLGGGNYSCGGLSVAATDSEIEIQLDQKVVFKSHQGNITRPDDLLQLSHLQLQLASTVKTLQQKIAVQQQEQAILVAERLTAQSKLAHPSTITPKVEERERGFTL